MNIPEQTVAINIASSMRRIEGKRRIEREREGKKEIKRRRDESYLEYSKLVDEYSRADGGYKHRQLGHYTK